MVKNPFKKKVDVVEQPSEEVKPVVEKEPVLTKEVTSGAGVEKVVSGVDEQEVKEAVKAVKAEKPFVEPDINNPEDGNKTFAELNS